MKDKVRYYHLPVWMSILVDSLIREGLAIKLKNSGTNDRGFYRFITNYGEETGREEILVVWSAKTSARAVITHLKTLVPKDARMLVDMAEEYAKERDGRDEPKVYSGIVQLLIARAVELYSKERPGKTLTINGSFGLIGQLPPNGRLCINGKVERVEGSTGDTLEVKCEECPEMEFSGMATKKEGIWQIIRTSQNCVFPPG